MARHLCRRSESREEYFHLAQSIRRRFRPPLHRDDPAAGLSFRERHRGSPGLFTGCCFPQWNGDWKKQWSERNWGKRGAHGRCSVAGGLSSDAGSWPAIASPLDGIAGSALRRRSDCNCFSPVSTILQNSSFCGGRPAHELFGRAESRRFFPRRQTGCVYLGWRGPGKLQHLRENNWG